MRQYRIFYYRGMDKVYLPNNSFRVLKEYTIRDSKILYQLIWLGLKFKSIYSAKRERNQIKIISKYDYTNIILHYETIQT